MKSLIPVVLAVISQVTSSHIPVGVTVGLTPYSHPVQSLYHAQDNFGQYVYGYSTPTSSKTETKTADGVTQGGYSYIDSNGILQTVQYVADAVHGFRVAASNLPQDLPDVAYAKASHLANFEAVKAEHAQIAAQRTVQYSNPIAVPISAVPQVAVLPQPVQDLPEVVQARAQHLAAVHAAYVTGGVLPQPVHDLPEVIKARAEHLATFEATKVRDAALRASAVALSPIPADFSGSVIPVHTAPVTQQHVTLPVAHAAHYSYTPAVLHAPLTSQYHSQDELGQYSYGYVGPLSSKSETKTADGVTRGGYSYIDANGIVQTVHYVADDVNGFRVAASNLPVDGNSVVAAPVVHQAAARVVHAPVVPVQHVAQRVVTKTVIPGLYSTEIVY